MTSVRSTLAEAAKRAIWQFQRHNPGSEADILLFSHRRGGSTWLMEVIAANRGLRYIDQPLSSHPSSPVETKYLPPTSAGQYIHLSSDTEGPILNYLRSILAGSLSVGAPWEIWASSFDRVSDRLVLKIVSAGALIEQIGDRLGASILFQTRHPIPTALSIIRNGWPPYGHAFVDGPFRAEHLDDDQAAFCDHVLRRGSLLEKHVLDWCLSNLVPLRRLPERPDWHYVSYEEAVLCPDEVVAYLARALELQDVDAMRKAMLRPSRSTRRLVSQPIGDLAPVDRLGRWRETVGQDAEQRAFEILGRLGISLYRVGSDVPSYSRMADDGTADGSQ